MADRIRAAAEAADFDRLAELALAGETPFTASFGLDFIEPDELAAYWRGLAREGEPVAETMLGLLRLEPHSTSAHTADGEEIDIFVSPAVMHIDDPDDRAALEEVLGAERVSGWWADGMYLGYRLGIDAAGDWRFFVIGD